MVYHCAEAAPVQEKRAIRNLNRIRFTLNLSRISYLFRDAYDKKCSCLEFRDCWARKIPAEIDF